MSATSVIVTRAAGMHIMQMRETDAVLRCVPQTSSVPRIGISGWTYPRWRGEFYPPGLPHRRELEYASRRLNSIEINGTFYALQRPASFMTWHRETPAGFVFA